MGREADAKPPASRRLPEWDDVHQRGWYHGVMTAWLDSLILQLTSLAPEGTYLSYPFAMKGLLAIVLVSLVCGAVGSLVVGNRMAFFSDALAHCMFAGAILGILLGLGIGAEAGGPYYEIGVPLIMTLLGALMGAGIAFVREKTGLSNDTVIGVFFALSIGVGAVQFKQVSRVKFATPEQFLFGDPNAIPSIDLLFLFLLAILTLAILVLISNQLLFTTFNLSLARSRNLPVRFYNIVFIVLLSLIVNLSLRTVGALLINALLIVPAATAANLCSNLRQMFWTSLGLSFGVSVVGYLWSLELNERLGWEMGQAGFIVVLAVVAFAVSMVLGPLIRGRRPGLRTVG